MFLNWINCISTLFSNICFSLSFLLTSWPLILSSSAVLLSFPSFITALLTPHFQTLLCLPPLTTIIRYSPSSSGRVPGAWVSTTRWRLLRQAAAAGATVRVVQSSQLAAAHQRPGLHRLRHQVHRAGEPWGLLGWLPERSAFGGPKGGFYHRLPEDGCRVGGRPPSNQCGPRRLRGRPKVAERQQNDVLQSRWAHRDSLGFMTQKTVCCNINVEENSSMGCNCRLWVQAEFTSTLIPLFAIHAITTRWQKLPLATSDQGGILTLFINGGLLVID